MTELSNNSGLNLNINYKNNNPNKIIMVKKSRTD